MQLYLRVNIHYVPPPAPRGAEQAAANSTNQPLEQDTNRTPSIQYPYSASPVEASPRTLPGPASPRMSEAPSVGPEVPAEPHARGEGGYGLVDFLKTLLFGDEGAELREFAITDEELLLLKGFLLGRLYSGRNQKVKMDLQQLSPTNFVSTCSAHRKRFGHQRMNILKRSLFPKFVRRIEALTPGLSYPRPADNIYSNPVIRHYFEDPFFDNKFRQLCRDPHYLRSLLAENEKQFAEGFVKWKKQASAHLHKKIHSTRAWAKVHLPISRNCLEKFVKIFKT